MLHALHINTSDDQSHYDIIGVNTGRNSSGQGTASLHEVQTPLGGGGATTNNLSLYNVQYDQAQNSLTGQFSAFFGWVHGTLTVSWSTSPSPEVTIDISGLPAGNRHEVHQVDAATLTQLTDFASGF